MIRLIVGLTGLALSAAAPAAAQSPETGAAAAADNSKNAEPREDALELTRLLNPAGPMAELAARGFDQAFDQGVAGGEMAALEKEHPGLIAELRKAARDVVIADVRASMPAIHRRYARFFSDHFTPAEIAELTQFYRTPTGAKIIQTKFAKIDVSGVVEKVTEDPNAKISSADVEAMNKGVVSAMWQGMTAADLQVVMAFGLRPVARKLKEAAPAMAAIEAQIANEPDPALDAAIEEATRKVYERYGLAE
jgi:hypothetical protein